MVSPRGPEVNSLEVKAMGYDESQEGYERAYAQHREAHGPSGSRSVYSRNAPEPADAKDAELRYRLAQFGVRVLEILRSRQEGAGDWAPAAVAIDTLARSLGLLPQPDAKEEAR
jgi:hypothetical protein